MESGDTVYKLQTRMADVDVERQVRVLLVFIFELCYTHVRPY